MFSSILPLFSLFIAFIFFPLAGFLFWEAFREWREKKRKDNVTNS